MSALQGGLAAFDHARGDLREMGELRGQDSSGRSGPNDEHINLIGQWTLLIGVARGRSGNGRIAVGVSVEMVLHRKPSVHVLTKVQCTP